MKSVLIISFLLLFSVFTTFSQEQKITLKKDLVSINNTPLFKLASSNYPNSFTLYNLENERLAVFNAHHYNDSRQVNSGNPQGRIGYFDITFLNEDMDKCEIRIVGMKKHLAQLIYSEKLVRDGKLDEVAVKQFCRIHGIKFSEEQKRTGSTVIINN